MPDHRVTTLEALSGKCAALRADGKSIALCHGAFDLLHPGHIHHLQAARTMADVLVVTLTEDRFIRKGPGRPAFNERLRADSVAAIQAVDFVATCPFATGVEAIEAVKPNLYVKGKDYRDAASDVTGAIEQERRAVERVGGRLVFTDGIQFSSSKLLNHHFGVLSPAQRDYLGRLKERFAASDVLSLLDSLRSTRVLVVGEAIIDEYHYCTPDAISNKSPTLSARFESAERFDGGVLAVGRHLASLCESVTVLAGTGTDGLRQVERATVEAERTDHASEVMGDSILASVSSDSLTVHAIARPDAPTVRKRRFVHRFANQKLFEVTFLDDRPIPTATQTALLDAVDVHAANTDLVIVTDFGHGFLTPPVIRRLRERAAFLAVNAQINSSNRGFNSIRKYKGADYVSVDEYEIRLPYGDRYAPLEDLAVSLGKEIGCPRINVTLGDKGTLYFDGGAFHRAPVFTDRVVDTIGAGDALLAVTALLAWGQAPSELIPFVGNCMGGLMTQIVGHRRPVDAVDLKRFISTLLK